MSDSTIRVGRNCGFTVVQNNAARDPRLSLAATGLYLRLMSLPDNKPHSLKYIMKVAGCGRDMLRRCFSELEAAGYLAREQTHVDHGKFGTNAYVLYDEPISPSTGFPSTVKPTTAEPTTAEPSPENPPTKEITKERNNPPIVPQGDASVFELFWIYYRDTVCATDHSRAGNKGKAKKAWDKLKPDRVLLDRIATYLMAQIKTDEWSRGIGIPHASTLLNAIERGEYDLTPPQVQTSAAQRPPDLETPQREENQWIT